MKKTFFASLVVLFLVGLLFGNSYLVSAQTEEDIQHVESLLQNGHFDQAYVFSKEKCEALKPSDSAYLDAVAIFFQVATYYEQHLRMLEDFNKGLEVNRELLDLIHKYKKSFNQEFANQEYFIYRNLVVCYTGLGKYSDAQKYRQMLYKAEKKKKLPCEYELCHYFNFDFFKVDTLNVWGYEWYDPLPKDRFSSSFTKIVYYVYSTDASGNDEDQLYRLHVIMFHGTQQPFDYIMDKHITTENGEISGSMYAYTYKEDIDFKKLHDDVLEIVKESKQSDSRRFIPN